MTKLNNKTKASIILIILAVVYSAIVFALPFKMNAVFWISYLFTMAAILGQAFIWHYAWGDSKLLRSKFYGFPIIVAGGIYLGVQLLTGLLAMLFAKWLVWWIPFVIYVILLGVALAGCIAADVSRDIVEDVEEKQVINTAPIREMRAMAAALSVPDTENALVAKVEELKEALRYSDPVSSEELLEIEASLKGKLQSLHTFLSGQDYVKAADITEQFLLELQQRNELCKVYKKK